MFCNKLESLLEYQISMIQTNEEKVCQKYTNMYVLFHMCNLTLFQDTVEGQTVALKCYYSITATKRQLKWISRNALWKYMVGWQHCPVKKVWKSMNAAMQVPDVLIWYVGFHNIIDLKWIFSTFQTFTWLRGDQLVLSKCWYYINYKDPISYTRIRI